MIFSLQMNPNIVDLYVHLEENNVIVVRLVEEDKVILVRLVEERQ